MHGCHAQSAAVESKSAVPVSRTSGKDGSEIAARWRRRKLCQEIGTVKCKVACKSQHSRFEDSEQHLSQITRQLRRRGARFVCSTSSKLAILNSSRWRPALRAATSHRGCFPLPDQVSDGLSGLKYLGKTFGYLRRGARSAPDFKLEVPGCLMISTRFNWANRFSSSRFSARILSDSNSVSSSWMCQSSSNSIVLRSGLRIALTVRLDDRVDFGGALGRLCTSPSQSSHYRLFFSRSPKRCGRSSQERNSLKCRQDRRTLIEIKGS